jgi:uridine kinase
MDQYFRTSSRDADPRDVNFDHPAHLDFRLMTNHLRKLRNGKSVLAPTYDFVEMVQRPASMPLLPKSVVLVEGLFVLAQPMVHLFDMTIFLDVDADQRLLGRILRDSRERGATTESLVDRYQRFVRPSYDVFVAPTRQNADVVVDFTFRRILFTKMLTLLLKSYIEEGLDLASFAKEMRAECNHLGFTPRDGEMPISIDINKLARAFPESVSAAPTFHLSHSPVPLIPASSEGVADR